MKIKEALSLLIKTLKGANIATYSMDALIILEKSTQKDDVFCLTNPDYKLSRDEMDQLNRLLEKRVKKYPMAYIQNSKEFYGFEFYVDENVLIPRPETELIVEEALKAAQEFKNPKIVDVGTGSGCIAITLSKLLNVKIAAGDISKKALDIAKMNAEKLEADVKFIEADTLSFLKEKVDIIVSNPPYIDDGEYENLQDDVKFEPKNALICRNGTQIIEKLINQAKDLCRYLIIEIGYDQEEFAKTYKNLLYVKKDFAGLPRIAVFRFD